MVYYMITYDVSSEFDKYRKKIADTLIDYGMMRIQYSVFLGDIGRNEAREIATKINDKLDLKIPIDIRFMRVCKSCLDKSFIITRDIKSSGLVATTMRSAIDRYVSYLTGREHETNISEEGWIEVYPKEGIGEIDGSITKDGEVVREATQKNVRKRTRTRNRNRGRGKYDSAFENVESMEDIDAIIGLPDPEEIRGDVAEYLGCDVNELNDDFRQLKETSERENDLEKEHEQQSATNDENVVIPQKKPLKKQDIEEDSGTEPSFVFSDKVTFI